jgi:hypothetical protein
VITSDGFAEFPMNVANTIALALEVIDPDVQIFRRPLRTTDPIQCISVVEVDWDPTDSMEMRGKDKPAEPTIQRYTIGVQAMVKDMEEQRGIVVHSKLARRVRHVLYRDEDLRIALRESRIQYGDFGEMSTETLQRHGIAGQQFMANRPPRGGFVFLSTVEFWFETQIS